MLWYYAPALFILLYPAHSFPRGKPTEKPEVPEMVNPQQRRPAHISEFTDPDTGLNPFLDLEEGRASMGRNVMEDERRDDQPYFDIDLVEGDVPDRKRIMEDPVEHLDRAPTRWLGFDYKDDNDFPVLTTASPPIVANPPTTVKAVTAKDVKEVKSNVIEEVQQKDMKDEKESFVVSPSTVIYATATLAVMTVIILLVGACWWRKKLKTSRSTTTVESGEAKS